MNRLCDANRERGKVSHSSSPSDRFNPARLREMLEEDKLSQGPSQGVKGSNQTLSKGNKGALTAADKARLDRCVLGGS